MNNKESFWEKLFKFVSFMDGFTNDNNNNDDDDTLMGWEEDLVDKGEYEPYNFEEEDMEDDDYYSEDE